jgi:hypothetical protein
MTDDKK